MGSFSGTIHLIGRRGFKASPTSLFDQLNPRIAATCEWGLAALTPKRTQGAREESVEIHVFAKCVETDDVSCN